MTDKRRMFSLEVEHYITASCRVTKEKNKLSFSSFLSLQSAHSRNYEINE